MSIALAHIAIAVDDMEKAMALYSALGFSVGGAEIIERENVRICKVKKEGLCLELLEPYPAGAGGVAKFLAKRGPGLHHVALRTSDIQSDLRKCEKMGINLLPGYPANGSEGSIVAFMHPNTTGGVLIELVEEKKEKV